MISSPDALMIFAAGRGTRMAPLTKTRPKPLISVAGQSLFQHALDQCGGANISQMVANVHYLAEQMEQHATTFGVTISDERDRLLDTGGGLRNALPHLPGEAVFTLNADAVWTGPPALETLATQWRPADMDALLLLVPAERATGHLGSGDFRVLPDGRLRRGGPFVYTGAQIIRTAPVAAHPFEVFSLNAIWNDLERRDRLFGVVHMGGWCDVGYPEAVPLAEAMLKDADDV